MQENNKLKDSGSFSQLTLSCNSPILYARACINKDFVHSGSIGRVALGTRMNWTYIGQGRALCYNDFLPCAQPI